MDLTAIDPLKLPSLPLEKKADLPDCPAIYFAISGSGEILYIGRTAALGRRWISHHRFKELIDLGNVKLAWLQCVDPSILKTLEAKLIYALKPKLNEQRTRMLSESARTPRILKISVFDSPEWHYL